MNKTEPEPEPEPDPQGGAAKVVECPKCKQRTLLVEFAADGGGGLIAQVRCSAEGCDYAEERLPIVSNPTWAARGWMGI